MPTEQTLTRTRTHIAHTHGMGINKYFVARLNIHPGGQFFVKIFSVRFEFVFVFAADLVEFSPRARRVSGKCARMSAIMWNKVHK